VRLGKPELKSGVKGYDVTSRVNNSKIFSKIRYIAHITKIPHGDKTGQIVM